MFIASFTGEVDNCIAYLCVQLVGEPLDGSREGATTSAMLVVILLSLIAIL